MNFKLNNFDYSPIESRLGRELTDDELCAFGISYLSRGGAIDPTIVMDDEIRNIFISQVSDLIEIYTRLSESRKSGLHETQFELDRLSDSATRLIIEGKTYYVETSSVEEKMGWTK